MGSERYLPWKPSTRPAELLTQASAILGQGQLSLAKYLFIVAGGDAPGPRRPRRARPFLAHLLARADWRRDCHFHTETTIDTLDYSGSGFNAGSKLVVAARGPAIRSLPRELPAGITLPAGFRNPRVCLPGVVAVEGPRIEPAAAARGAERRRDLGGGRQRSVGGRHRAVLRARSAPTIRSASFRSSWSSTTPTSRRASLENFLWVTFTRSNPAADVHGVDASSHQKHWGCRGPLVIDARLEAAPRAAGRGRPGPSRPRSTGYLRRAARSPNSGSDDPRANDGTLRTSGRDRRDPYLRRQRPMAGARR